MNVKFILFSIASLASLVMMYMWFTMNRAVSDSQILEEKYSYRISSLKSEIEFEKNLMDSLRKDTKIHGKNYHEKSVILETMKQKETVHDKERLTLEKKTIDLNVDYDKVWKSNEDMIRKMKSEAESKELVDNEEIESLTNELKLLEDERNEMLKTLGKSHQNPEKTNTNVDKPNDAMMQGKPPKINKVINKSKEAKENDQTANMKNNQSLQLTITKVPLQLNQDDNKLNVGQLTPLDKHMKNVGTIKSRTRMKKAKSEPNVEIKPKLVNNKSVIPKESQVKDGKESDSQLESPSRNVKHDSFNDDVLSKDDFFNKNQHNPKILPRKDNPQLNAPKEHLKDVNSLVHNSDDQLEKPKDQEDGNYQLKPPRKEPQSERKKSDKFLDNLKMRNKEVIDEKRDM